MDKKLPEPNVLETAHSSCSEFVKKDVFEDRKQVSVEEVVTLIAALTDISVSLLSRFLKDQVDLAKATGVGRDVFKYILGRVGLILTSWAGPTSTCKTFPTVRLRSPEESFLRTLARD